MASKTPSGHRVGQGADRQQALPVAGVAHQTGNFQAHHDSHLPQTHVTDQLFETFTIATGAGLTQIAINHAHLLFAPAQRQRSGLEPILASGALPDSGAATPPTV